MKVWIPTLLSFLLGPGMGQIYNKQYKKAVFLLAISGVALVGAMVWLQKILMPYLPVDLLTADPEAVRATVTAAVPKVLEEHRGTFMVYQVILLVVWMYGVIDAYRVAKDKQPSAPSGQ